MPKMTMTLDYDEINAELIAARAGIRASECHGFLCGYFCASNSMVMELMQDHLLAGIDEAADLEDCYALLSRLGDQVTEDIMAEDISFILLLPGDEMSMAERASALSEWCSGFVSGLGIGGLGNKSSLNNECDEFIKDVVAISRMETIVDDSDDAESALFELVEYIRVGVIMLHQEWHQLGNQAEHPEVLH